MSGLFFVKAQMITFVLGNGESREGLDLQKLKSIGKVYGCNALYREFTPDLLVAVDREITLEIIDSGYSKMNTFYTRRVSHDAKQLPKKYYSFSSGPAAIGLAATNGATEVFLLGFDFSGGKQSFNNLYAGSACYKKMGATPTYSGNWKKQIATVVNEFPDTQFYRVIGECSEKDFHIHSSNFNTIGYSEFFGMVLK